MKGLRMFFLAMCMLGLISSPVMAKTISSANTRAVKKAAKTMLDDCNHCIGYTIMYGLESGETKNYVFTKAADRRYFANYTYRNEYRKQNALDLFGKKVKEGPVNIRAYDRLGVLYPYFTKVSLIKKRGSACTLTANVRIWDMESDLRYIIGKVRMELVLASKTRYGLHMKKCFVTRTL